MASNEDPFLQVQQDVLSQLVSTRPLFESYLRIRSLAKPSSSSPELAAARADLEAALESLAEDLADLVESVRAVQHNPQQYGLSVAEVQRRQRVVQEAGDEVAEMRRELVKSAAAGAGAGSGAPGTPGLPDPNSFALEDGDDNANGNADYEAFEREQQMQIMQEQDQQLESVFQTVGNLRQQADVIGRELEEQNEMLEVVDDLADRVDSRLQVGMHKLNTIIRRNEDRWSSCCIGVLIMVLIILLVLLLVL